MTAVVCPACAFTNTARDWRCMRCHQQLAPSPAVAALSIQATPPAAGLAPPRPAPAPAAALTLDQAAGFRLAGIILLCNVALDVIAEVLLADQPLFDIGIAIPLRLGFGIALLQRRRAAATWTKGLTAVAALALLVDVIVAPNLDNAVNASATWSTFAAVLLLLSAQPRRGRRALALVIYAVFTLLPLLLGLTGILLEGFSEPAVVARARPASVVASVIDHRAPRSGAC